MNDIPRKKNPVLVGFLALGLIAAVFFLSSIILISFLGKDITFRGSGDKIAVIDITGIIIDSADIIRQIKKYRKDSTVKGIVLRINSPGGAVAPSQEIYEEVLRTRDSKYNKKVVASMSTVAASGGYYIASASDRIIAGPGTITGSIGVIITFSNFSELMEKIGMKVEVIKSGKYKDIGSPNRSLTREDRKMLQGLIDDVYNQFVEAVAAGRDMNIGDVKKLADGRIFSGKQAKELGLVDELGGLEEAISLLAEQEGIKGEPVIVREEKNRGILYRLFRSYFSSVDLSDAPAALKRFSIQYLLPY